MKARRTFKTPAVIALVGTVVAMFASISPPESEAFAKPKARAKAAADAGAAKPAASAAPPPAASGVPAVPIDKAKKFTTRPGEADCGYFHPVKGGAIACSNAYTCCVGTDAVNRLETTCADFKSDALNCGGCGLKCAGGRTCKDGLCVPPKGSISCDGEWIDGTSDENNCGACGKKCKALCKDSKCISCDRGESVCDTQIGTHLCRDLKEDSGHCGKCFHECPSGWDCSNGRCVP